MKYKKWFIIESECDIIRRALKLLREHEQLNDGSEKAEEYGNKIDALMFDLSDDRAEECDTEDVLPQ